MLLVVFLIMLSHGCRKEFQPPAVENEFLAPIFKTTLSIDKIVPDSLQETDGNDLVSLVYRRTLYDAAMESFQELETREFNETAKLQTLSLGSKTAVRSVSLGQIAVAEGGATGAFIIAQNGNNSIIPPINSLSYGPIAVDGTEFFETVTLDSGYMDVTISNGFPTHISNVDFEIRNESDNSLVGTESFNNVPAGAEETKTIDLAGKTVEGALLGNILNFDINGTGITAVLIDTSDKITVTITVRDTKVNSATAVFPAQNLIELKDTNQMKNVQDLRLTAATAKSGIINLRVVSTIEDTMFFDYYVPSVTKDGQPLQLNEKINPAPSGGSIEKEFVIDVGGYDFDLTGAPLYNTYNAFYSELVGRIDSTGEVVTLSLSDSILVFVKLNNFVPEYVEGYLGNTEVIAGPEVVPFELFKSFSGGSFEFDQVEIAVGVSNGNGVPFEVAVDELQALNTKNGASVDIDLSSLGTPLIVESATDIYSPAEQIWTLENSQNLTDAINIFPDALSFGMTIASNPLMDSTDMDQFAVDSNRLTAFTDINIPLSLIADELTIEDTSEFSGSKIQVPEGLQSGTLYFLLDNTFELEANIEVEFLTSDGDILESISFQNPITASSGESVRSILEWPFELTDLSSIIASKQIVFRATLNTRGLNEYKKIYSTQSIDATMSLRFNYQFE